jgi:predicted small secreted protein
MKNSVKIIFALLGLAAMVLSSCNTVAGFGRDVQSAGGAIHDTAKR